VDKLIRKAEAKDIARLVELCQNHAAYEEIDFQPKGKAELLSKALFSDTPRLFCFVIESQGDLGGYFTYTFDFSTWDAQLFLYLDCLYLEPEFRGMGISEKIIENLRGIAQENNCVNIQFQTPVFNVRAIKFYNRMGALGKEKVRFSIPMEVHC